METTAVRVALRIRPLTENEQATTGSIDTDCITCAKDEPQIFLGRDRAFTFDHVYPPETSQSQVFETSIKDLLDCFLDGNNATVLAYGQTGSGKTYSVGTSLESFPDSESQGIIQRFASSLFERLGQKTSATSFQLYVSYLELYNEEIIDLLCSPTPSSTTTTTSTLSSTTNKKDETKHPAIREDVHGQIYWTGVREIPVHNIHDLLEHVKKGSFSRSTGSTNMNVSSSRSHAIFTITLKQQVSELDHTNEPQKSVKRLVSKFHFVDLAGSERLKRTNALGDRQKEGISINTGLLALGNVISALGDETRRGTHVPYRDSKLTRLLQDSLGGNSHTLMLACISPSPSDYMETLNTLKYANRARNIQNRVEINVDYDDSLEEVNHLKNQLSKLKSQLSSLRHLQQHRQQHHDTSLGQSGDYRSMDGGKTHTTFTEKSLAELQSGRDMLSLQHNSDGSIQAQSLTMEYLQHIQDLKFELAEANHRLVHLESQQQQQQHQEIHHQQPSISAALPGRFGSSSPTYRRNRTTLSATCSLDKNVRTGSLSTGGRRPIKHRKHSLPIGQRMKSTRKHGTIMTAPNSPPNLDDLWRFLDSDSTDSNLTEIREDNHSFSSRQEVKSETQYQREKKSTANATLPSPYSSNEDSMTQASSTKLNILPLSKIPCSSSLLPDSPVSTNTICHDLTLHDDDDDVQLLAVPSWTDEPKTQSVTDSTKRESLSWTDSLLDDSDISIATSRLSSTYWNMANNGKRHGGRRRSKDLLKILHQVQADLLVKKELVGQLEKSEDEYTQMRINYEDQLKSLEKHLVDMRYQRDYAIGEIEISDTNKANINSHQDITSASNSVINKEVDRQYQVTKPRTVNTRKQKMHTTALSPPAPPPPIGHQRRPQDSIPRQIKEIRLQYEGKIKRLTGESQEWKRKYIQTTSSMTSARTRAEQVVTKLRSTIDQMKTEKKQLQRTMKQDNDRLRDQLATAEQEIQQLKRKEVIHLDARKKWDDTNEQQQVMLKKRNDQTLQVNQQMRQLNTVLRKAANEGTFLNEAALERLLAQASTSSASPLQRQLSRSPPLHAMD